MKNFVASKPLVISMIYVVGTGVSLSAIQEQDSFAPKQPKVYTWENVGEITKISGKTFSIQRTLRISDSSWSLEPAAVSQASQLQNGDQIMARGKTLSDGTFETKRIYMVSPSKSHRQADGGKTIVLGDDHGRPESRYPRIPGYGDPTLEGRGRGGYPGGDSRVPPPGTPRGGNRGSPGGLQNARTSHLPRFLPGDLEGIIEQVSSESVILSQSFLLDKGTAIVTTDGKKLQSNELKVGRRVAVTIKDEVDLKRQARKATVVRLLP